MSEWLKTLLGVDADDIPADAVTSFQWGHLPRGSAALLLLLFVIAIVAGVIWIYRREGGAPTKAKIVLATLRAMVLLAAVVLLLEPVLAVDQVETIEKSTIVLVDDSLSMTTKDRYLDTVLRSRISNALGVEPSQMERSRLVEQALKSSGLYASLANQNSVEIFRFAGSAVLHVTLPRLRTGQVGTRVDPIDPNDRPSRAGKGTNLADSIRQAVEKVGSDRVAAIIVISDGRVNLGPPAADIAIFLKNKDLTLHTVAVGEAEPPRNLRAVALGGPDRVYRRDPAVFEAKIAAKGFTSATVIFERRYQGNEDWEGLDAKEVSFPMGGQPATIRFTDRPKGVGVVEYRIRVTEEPEELTYRDNKKVFITTVVDEKALVLLVGGTPSHEYRAVKNVLLRDKTIRVACFLQSADPEFAQDGNDISLRQLPMGEKELFKFDVILLFDPDGKYLPPDWTEILKDFVGEHRGGLGFVAGNKHTLNLLRGQGGNFMADLLPVVLDDQRADQPGVGIGYGRHWNQPWRMVPEPAGLRHAATRFHSNPRRARAEVWDRLPPFYWNFPVLREKPGATVLARHEDPRESVEPYGQRPIIAVHRYGGGNVMFLATDETNRWRARAEPIFDRFWVQSVRFLIEGRHAGKKKQFRIYLDREVVDLGDALQIDAEVFDETYQPLELEEVQILVTGPNDKEHAVTLQPAQDKPGRYTGSFSPVIEGDYEVRAADVKFKTKSPSATFMVKFPDREMGDVRVDEALLSDLARRTRGLSPKIYELEKLADPKLIPPVTERIVTQGTPIPLWDTWLTIIVIVTLLCAEWILRKKFRMV